MQAHLDRLWNSAKAILLTIPMTKDEMAKAIEDTLAVNGIQDGYIRAIVTRGRVRWASTPTTATSRR